MNLADLTTPEISFFSAANNQFSNIVSHLELESCKKQEVSASTALALLLN